MTLKGLGEIVTQCIKEGDLGPVLDVFNQKQSGVDAAEAIKTNDNVLQNL
jgi:hypothetical protein